MVRRGEDYSESLYSINLAKYLRTNGVEISYHYYPYYSKYYKFYSFTEEYTFDVSARYITYKDTLGVVRSLPTSVVPVMEKEGSGGTSDSPFDLGFDWEKLLTLLKTLLALIIVLALIVLIYIAITKIMDRYERRQLNKSITETNKSLKQFKKIDSNEFKKRK